MQSALAKVAPQARQALVQSRQMSSVVSSPPTVRISFVEKVAHGLVIGVGCLATPAWVLANLKNYRERS